MERFGGGQRKAEVRDREGVIGGIGKGARDNTHKTEIQFVVEGGKVRWRFGALQV